MLESYLQDRLKANKILLMTHIVLGYPSFEDSFKMIEAMVAAGVDLMELQIPFSEPIADGPVILKANQKALELGTTVQKCIRFTQAVSRQFDIPLLFMSYYNILFKFGMDKFIAAMADAGLQGAIVPDLPPEEGGEYLDAMQRHHLAPIFIFSPTTPEARMKYLSSLGKGFIYCVARKGVTGAQTDFSKDLDTYLARCRNATELPLALGFGVKDRSDVAFITGKVDIAVIGSQTIRIVEKHGIRAVGEFIKSLR